MGCGLVAIAGTNTMVPSHHYEGTATQIEDRVNKSLHNYIWWEDYTSSIGTIAIWICRRSTIWISHYDIWLFHDRLVLIMWFPLPGKSVFAKIRYWNSTRSLLLWQTSTPPLSRSRYDVHATLTTLVFVYPPHGVVASLSSWCRQRTRPRLVIATNTWPHRDTHLSGDKSIARSRENSVDVTDKRVPVDLINSTPLRDVIIAAE